MKFLEKSIDYVESNVGVTPEYITVNDLYGRFKLKAKFANRDSTSFRISPDSELYELYIELFKSIRDRIELSPNSSVRRYSLSSYIHEEDGLLDEWGFYTGKEADVRADVYVELDFSKIDVDRLYKVLLEEIRSSSGVKLDPSNILDFQILFSDIKPVEVQTVRGSLYTKYPHMFYKNVSSVSEFAEKSSSDKTVSGSEYEVDFIYSTDNDDLSENAEDVFESELVDAIDSSVDILGNEYMLEGEAICIGDNLYQSDGDCAFSYIKIPITEDGIFTVH